MAASAASAVSKRAKQLRDTGVVVRRGDQILTISDGDGKVTVEFPAPKGDGEGLRPDDPKVAAYRYAADNVVTYVPGTFAKLDGIGEEIDRADRTVWDAQQADPAQQTSALVWMGYRAPQSLLGEAGDTDLPYAKDAAPNCAGSRRGCASPARTRMPATP